jgi:type II secretory pathway component PulF|tara:strand:+ start:444 stop:1526 length:1083 start_codon:yes stop_codon:yes gene_type:complete
MGIEIGKTGFTFQDRVDFLRTLSSWLTSGGGSMSIADCIKNTCDAFSYDEFKTLAPRMTKIVEDYRSGQVRFAEALHKANVGFTRQEITVILTAEESNQLRQAVQSMVDAMKMQQEAKRQLAGSLRGPMISGIMLIFMTLGVAYFMLPIVLGPTIEKDADVLFKFPFIIRYFWYFSAWLNENPAAPFIIFATPLTYFLLHITGPAKKTTEKVLMSWSASRRIIIAYNGLLLVYFMPALVRSGMPVYNVLKALSDMINNSEIKTSLMIAANDNEAGVPLSECISKLPMRVSFKNAVSAGEKTGAIAERIEDLKTPYTSEYERLVTRFVGTIKFMVMVVLLPMFIMSMYTSLVAPIFALLEF